MDKILIILKKENGPRASSAPALGLNTIIFKYVYWYMKQISGERLQDHWSSGLKYVTLIQSIPRRWKTNIKHENVNTPLSLTIINQILKAKQTNKFIYQLLLKEKPQTESKSEQKWERTICR